MLEVVLAVVTRTKNVVVLGRREAGLGTTFQRIGHLGEILCLQVEAGEIAVIPRIVGIDHDDRLHLRGGLGPFAVLLEDDRAVGMGHDADLGRLVQLDFLGEMLQRGFGLSGCLKHGGELEVSAGEVRRDLDDSLEEGAGVFRPLQCQEDFAAHQQSSHVIRPVHQDSREEFVRLRPLLPRDQFVGRAEIRAYRLLRQRRLFTGWGEIFPGFRRGKLGRLLSARVEAPQQHRHGHQPKNQPNACSESVLAECSHLE